MVHHRHDLTTGNRLLIHYRQILSDAVRKRCASQSHRDKLKRTIVCLCLRQSLVSVQATNLETEYVLNGTGIAAVENELARAQLHVDSLLDTLSSPDCSSWCGIVVKAGTSQQPQVLPWLHDILTPASPEVRTVLAKVGTLRQPRNPPGFPVGSPHKPADQPAPESTLSVATMMSTAPQNLNDISQARLTKIPPAGQAKQILMNALTDVWPGDDPPELYLRTTAHICLHLGFDMGWPVGYELKATPVTSLVTHLHRHGLSTWPPTFHNFLALPHVQPYFKIAASATKDPTHVLLHIANVYNGHPNPLISKILQQTHSVQPGQKEHVQYAPDHMSPALRATLAIQPPPPAASADTCSSHAASSAVAAADPEDAALTVVQARMKLMMAISGGAACNDQTDLHHLVRRGISWACLQGLVADDQNDDQNCTANIPSTFKLHSVLVADVGRHLEQQIFTPLGRAAQHFQDLLWCTDHSQYFWFSRHGNSGTIMPFWRRLIQYPDHDVKQLIMQINHVVAPMKPHAAASENSSCEQHYSRHPVPDLPAHSPATLHEYAGGFSKCDWQVQLLASVGAVEAAMIKIGMHWLVAVGCTGFNLSESGDISLIQVFADKTCYIFDVMVPDPDAKAAVIRAVQVLMESASIIKVMHGCAPSSAALKYKLDIGLTLVVDLEVLNYETNLYIQKADACLQAVHFYMQSLAALSTKSEKPANAQPQISLEELSEHHGIFYPGDDVSATDPKEIWNKRPAAEVIQRHSVNIWHSLLPLASTMMRKLGSQDWEAILCRSRQVSQRSFQPADKDPEDAATRTNASHTEKKLFPLNSEQTASIQSGGLIAAVHSSPSTAAAVNDDSNSQAKAGNL